MTNQPDLEALWAEHLRHEFDTKSTPDTLLTMVENAYVNHVPVMTGGYGKEALDAFYSTHFIPRMPADVELTPISRTVGEDRLVDEFIFKFTHDMEMDWMLPGTSTHPQAGGGAFRGDRAVRGRQAGPRAHLLGPSHGTGAVGVAGTVRPACRRH